MILAVLDAKLKLLRLKLKATNSDGIVFLPRAHYARWRGDVDMRKFLSILISHESCRGILPRARRFSHQLHGSQLPGLKLAVYASID